MNPELPLRDIHQAVPPDWWPPGPGWWVVLAVGLATLTFCLMKAYRSWRRARIRRRLATELAAIERLAETDPDRFLEQLAVLLKRLVIHGCGRRELAGSHGERWKRALLEVGESESLSKAAEAVVRDQYRPRHDDVPVAALTELARRWVDRVAAEAVR